MANELNPNLKEVIFDLLHYCLREKWTGYDPYDGLNSRLFNATPLMRSKLFRLVLIQSLKRLPINLRPLLLIDKTTNPKALALFLSALIELKVKGLRIKDEWIKNLIFMLQTSRYPEEHYCVWGYSFPWQTRTVLVPRHFPNLVCTVFVADALLDAHEYYGDKNCLDMAISAARYLVEILFWSEKQRASFSYPLPNIKSMVVHNANFLAGALLARIYSITCDKKFLEPGLKACKYSASKQDRNGAWLYGESRTQKWIDNFHTGFNLCALKKMDEYIGSQVFNEIIRKGFSFYRENFFEKETIPKYYHNNKYPVDAHTIAQSLITLKDFTFVSDNTKLIENILNFTLRHMKSDKGFFYYQITPFYKNKISYIRWSQAWMLKGLAHVY